MNRLAKNRGGVNADVLFFFGFFLVLGALWVIGGGPQRNGAAGNNASTTKRSLFGGPIVLVPTTVSSNTSSGSKVPPASGGSSSGASSTNIPSTDSPFKGKVKIYSTGSARTAKQPNKEYISLEANRSNKEPVTITGWFLTNNDGRLVVSTNNDMPVYGIQKKVFIPAGRVGVATTVATPLQAIALKPGDRAVIVTGSPPSVSPDGVVGSFRSNVCTGYLEGLKYSDFSPQLNNNCPRPADEDGYDSVDEKCQDFIKRMARCHTPEFPEYVMTRNGAERGYVDNVGGLTGQCRAYLQAHFSYRGCLLYHGNDAKFDGAEWRVFLNRYFDLWYNNKEIITLYDGQGRLVDRISY